MSGVIIKLGGRYFEWSTVSDAPRGGPFDLDGLRAYLRAEYGEEGVTSLPGRLARVEAKGTSSPYDKSVADTVRYNRAGPDESRLSLRQLEAMCAGGGS